MNQHAYNDTVRLTVGTYRFVVVRASPQCELGPRRFTNSPYSCVVLNHHFRLPAEPVSAGKTFDHLGFSPPRKHGGREPHFYMTVKTGQPGYVFCFHNSGCGRGWTTEKSWFDSREGHATIPAVLFNGNRGTFTMTKSVKSTTLPI